MEKTYAENIDKTNDTYLELLSLEPCCMLCEDDGVIYSGVDAFCFGVPTETFCYDCASIIYNNVTKPLRAFYTGVNG